MDVKPLQAYRLTRQNGHSRARALFLGIVVAILTPPAAAAVWIKRRVEG